MYENKLIYGKNQLDRIVSIEVKEDQATIFRELSDGSLDIKKVPNRFWILATKPFGPGWIRLEGEQDFKFGKQFSKFSDYRDFKKSVPYQETYSISNPTEALQVKDGYTYYKNLRHDEVSILSFDIEATGLDHNDDSKVILISNTFRKNGQITRKLFSYDDYDNCAHMIDSWAEWVCEVDPSIICGHNIYGFDFPYLQFCHSKYSDKGIILGRLNHKLTINTYDSKYRVDGSRELHYKKAKIYGREICDTMFLAYKYDAVKKNYESYGLKPIIKFEKLEKEDRVFYDANLIRVNYMIPEEMVKIKAYAEDDADDSLKLYDLMVPPTFYLTQSIPKPFQLVVESATGAQINSLLVRAYLQDKKSVAKTSNLEGQTVEGGISFAVPGIYKNIFKVDIKSCYPSQILRFKLFDKDKDPNGYYHELVEYFTLQRFEYKKKTQETKDKFYENLDAMAKIFINSAYGVVNTSGLNYNSIDIARKITQESRAIIDMSLRWASGDGYHNWATKFYEAVGTKDTDRVYLSLPEQELPTKYTHDFIIGPSDTDSISFCKKDMSPFSPEEIKQLLAEINEQSPEKVLWEDDGLYKTIIALKAKNYVLYDGKKLKIKGSALKGSTKSEALKELTKRFIETMAYTEEIEQIHTKLKEVYGEYVHEAMNVDNIQRWAARKTLSSTMVESERTNELKVMEAIEGADFQEGDRLWVFYKNDDSLSLVSNFDGDYNKKRLLKNIYDTSKIFSTILPIKELFINFSLKKNYGNLIANG